MNDQPTAAQRERAEVCGVYAAAVGDLTLSEVIKNYQRWGTGHGFDGDMLAIGLAHNTSAKTQQAK